MPIVYRQLPYALTCLSFFLLPSKLLYADTVDIPLTDRPEAEVSETFARVSTLQGTGSVLRARSGATEPLTPDTLLYSGDLLRTQQDTELTLILKDGSRFTVQPNSRIAIDARLVREEPVGTVLFTHGDTSITSQDLLYRKAIRGGKVYQGDIIVTGKASSLQLRMADDGYFAVRPESEVAINTYVYEKTADDQVATTLIRGGLRSITGQIGQQNKDRFQIATPVATIGIRGTDLDAYYQSAEQAEEKAKDGQPAPEGSYLKVTSGEAALSNDGGSQAIQANEFAYTADAEKKPASLPPDQIPVVFTYPTYETPIPGLTEPLPEPPPRQTRFFSVYAGTSLASAGRYELLEPATSYTALDTTGIFSTPTFTAATTTPLPPTGLYRQPENNLSALGLNAGGYIRITPTEEQETQLNLDLQRWQSDRAPDLTQGLIQLHTRYRLESGITLGAAGAMQLSRFTGQSLTTDTALPQNVHGEHHHSLNLNASYPLHPQTKLMLSGQYRSVSPFDTDTSSDLSEIRQQQWQAGIIQQILFWNSRLQSDLMAGEGDPDAGYLQSGYWGLHLNMSSQPSDALTLNTGATFYKEGRTDLKQLQFGMDYRLTSELSLYQHTRWFSDYRDQSEHLLAVLGIRAQFGEKPL